MKKYRKRGWQYHLMKRLQIVGDHIVYTGKTKLRSGTPAFSAVLNGKIVSRSAVSWMYFMLNGKFKKATSGETRICDQVLCVNPDHYTDYSKSKMNPNRERDTWIRETWNKHSEFKQWTQAAMGRKYGISRQRVRQIIGRNDG